jgi:hypothetical protein
MSVSSWGSPPCEQFHFPRRKRERQSNKRGEQETFYFCTVSAYFYLYGFYYVNTVSAILTRYLPFLHCFCHAYTVQVFTYLGHYFAQEKEGGSFLDAPKAIKCYRTALKSNLLNEEAGWGLSELLMCAEGKKNYEVCALHVLP